MQQTIVFTPTRLTTNIKSPSLRAVWTLTPDALLKMTSPAMSYA